MGRLAALNEACARAISKWLEGQSLGGTKLHHLDAIPSWEDPTKIAAAPSHTGGAPPNPPSGGSSGVRPSRAYSEAVRPAEFRSRRPAFLPEPDPRMFNSGHVEFPVTHPKRLDDASLEDLFGAMLSKLDPNPDRDGIAETPARAAKAWRYWCSGYGEDVDALFKSFEDGAEGYDEMVIVSNIPVLSHCEHHLAAISGFAHVGYIPDGRVVGLSKLARVVDTLSRRLQVQERLTVQIADAVERNLKPKGVGVIIKAAHGCMSSRGVRIHGSVTTTSALRGALHEGPARAEFLSLCASAERKNE